MSAISGSLTGQGAAATNAFEALSSQDFLEVIFTELTSQDPLSPNDTKDLLQQISTIRSIESDLALGDKLENMLRRSEITSASSLVGKFITGLADNGADVAGYVDSVTITREGIGVRLSDGSSIPLTSVTEIIDPALIAAAPPESDPVDEQEDPLATDDTGDSDETDETDDEAPAA